MKTNMHFYNENDYVNELVSDKGRVAWVSRQPFSDVREELRLIQMANTVRFRNLVVVMGHNRVGKTTLAGAFAKKLNAKIYPFAKPLKEDLQRLGLPESYISSKTAVVRKLLQAYGEARRELHGPNYFVEKWLINVYSSNHSRDIIVDDCYHLNEFSLLLNMQAENKVFIFVSRDGVIPENFDAESVMEAEILRNISTKYAHVHFLHNNSEDVEGWKKLSEKYAHQLV